MSDIVDKILVEGRDEIPIEEEKGPSVEELKVEYEKMQVEMEKMKAESDLASSWKEGLSDLGDKLATPQAQQINPQQQQKDFEDWKKKANKDWYKDPAGNAMNLFSQKLMPEVERTLNNKLQTSREFCRLDPETSKRFKQYEAEVDAEVSKSTPLEKNDLQIYQKALKKVSMNHMSDIVQEAVDKALKKRDEEEKKTSHTNNQFSEAGVNPRTPPVKMIKVSKEDWDKNVQEARAKGFGHDPERYWRIKHGKY